MDGHHRDWMGTILTRKPLFYKRFGACWERLGSLAGGESGIRTHGTVRVVDNPPTSKAGMVDRTSFAPETTSPERNERDQSPTKIQQNQRSLPLSPRS
jgi:hypothetical protein